MKATITLKIHQDLLQEMVSNYQVDLLLPEDSQQIIKISILSELMDQFQKALTKTRRKPVVSITLKTHQAIALYDYLQMMESYFDHQVLHYEAVLCYQLRQELHKFIDSISTRYRIHARRMTSEG